MNHGVYTDEKATQIAKPRVTTTGIPFVVGTAPIHRLADPSAAVNKVIKCETLAEAKAKLGYSEDFAAFDLCQAMYFDLSVRMVAPIIFVNVLDPSKAAHTKTVAATAVTITNGQGTLDEKYMLINDDLIVKDGDAVLVKDTDYTVEHTEDDKLLITIITGTHASVTVEGKALKPDGVTAADIIGGEDTSTGVKTGLSLIDKVYPTFGFTAATIIAPNWSKNPTVAAAMAGITTGINGLFRAFTVIDIDSSIYKKPADAEQMKAAVGVKSPNAYLVWLMGKVGTHIVAGSVIAAATFQYTDEEIGNGLPYYPPSNKSAYVDSVVLADGTEMILTSEEGNVLNDKGIATFIKVGDDIRLWGDETAAFPNTNDPKDVFVNIRRFYSWYENRLIIDYFDLVDGPINPKLVETIVDNENVVLNGYVSAGACLRGEIAASPSNTAETLAAGQIFFDVILTIPTPAKEIRFTVTFDPEALMNALAA